MPSRTKLKNAAIAARSAALPKIPDELIDQFVTGPMTGEAVNAASMAFKKALIERAMGAELGHHLGYAAGAAKPEAGSTTWQARPLEPMYPVVFFDALRVKIKEDAVVRNKAIYLALGVLPDGSRDILGLWLEGTEGAKFWMKVFNDLKTRGVNDILIAVTDGLKGMPEALSAVFPATTLQTCIVHLIRNSLDYASWKDRKLLAAAIRPIYTAANADAEQAELDAFEQGPWGQKFPTVVGLLAPRMESRDPVLCLPTADPASDLHDQCHREHQREVSKDHQVPGSLPQRRCGQQADLAGTAKHHSRVGKSSTQLEGSHEPVCDPL